MKLAPNIHLNHLIVGNQQHPWMTKGTSRQMRMAIQTYKPKVVKLSCKQHYHTHSVIMIINQNASVDCFALRLHKDAWKPFNKFEMRLRSTQRALSLTKGV